MEENKDEREEHVRGISVPFNSFKCSRCGKYSKEKGYRISLMFHENEDEKYPVCLSCITKLNIATSLLYDEMKKREADEVNKWKSIER